MSFLGMDFGREEGEGESPYTSGSLVGWRPRRDHWIWECEVLGTPASAVLGSGGDGG